MNKLPEECLVLNPTSGEIVMVKRGVAGYFPQNPDNAPWGAENIDLINERMGVTKAQKEAMLAGSMFGWDAPVANPDNYDENGDWIK